MTCVRCVITFAVLLTALALSAAAEEAAPAFEFCAPDLAALARRFGEFADDLPPAAQLGIRQILAFEENAHFVYVCGTAPAGDRRIVFCKPATFIVFDVSSDGNRPWALTGAGRKLGSDQSKAFCAK
jgi:hypothetical protein